MDKLNMGRLYTVAAALFWIAWRLMPGVGVTDPAQIFELVSALRTRVAVSVLTQLVSAVLYVPSLISLASHSELGDKPGVRTGVVLMLVGAMGSASDAVLHLLAYAMTAPDIDTVAMVPVMGFMQGPGLVLLAPLILAFFIGGGRLSYALAHAGIISRRAGHLHWAALAVAAIGGMLASRGVISGRVVGLSALALVSAAQAWTGIALAGGRRYLRGAQRAA